MDWDKQEVIRMLKNQPGTHYQECSDAEKKVFRDWLRGMLQQTSVKVDFVKADGSTRQMNCTLNWNMIPADKQPAGTTVVESASPSRDSEVLRVFDLEKTEWRSFRFDRLQAVSLTIGMED
jgi:hypothetical protein